MPSSVHYLEYTADELLQYAFSQLLKQNSGRLPFYKYRAEAKERYPLCEELAKTLTYDDLISSTIKKNRKCLGAYTSAAQIWKNEKSSLEKATRLISHLTEEQMKVDELEEILKGLFQANVNVLQDSGSAATHIRRLIRIYDYLKWNK